MPDPQKLTKRKTKIAKSTYHPTYNEMVSDILLMTERRFTLTLLITGLPRTTLLFFFSLLNYNTLQRFT